MSVRRAETKDLPRLVTLMQQMLEANRQLGGFVTADQNQLVGGIMEYLALRLNSPTALVLVSEHGFLSGNLEKLPAFNRVELVAFLEYMYPISFEAAPLAKAFYEWARERQAGCVFCFSPIIDKFITVYGRHGFKPAKVLMIKEL